MTGPDRKAFVRPRVGKGAPDPKDLVMRTFYSVSLWFAVAAAAWSQTMNDTIFSLRTDAPVVIDGEATETCWKEGDWHAIDQVWIPWGAALKEGDFEGRFKVAWDENYLYVLVEIVDDSLSDDHPDPLSHWWDDDCLEIFVDENRSMGDHELNCNAFAYHVSLFYDAIDLNSSGQGVNYRDHVEVKMDTIGDHLYLWEIAIRIYGETYTQANPEASRIFLEPGRLMGLAVAYCDNDETTSRENFIGSMQMTQPQHNDMYRNADHFGPLVLARKADLTHLQVEKGDPGIRVFPVPVRDFLRIETPGSHRGVKQVSLRTITGEPVFSESLPGNVHTIETEYLEKGLYLLEISQHGESHSRLIVKQ